MFDPPLGDVEGSRDITIRDSLVPGSDEPLDLSFRELPPMPVPLEYAPPKSTESTRLQQGVK